MQRIDILAIDASDRVYAIECKWDAIRSRTIAQLLEYRDALLRHWRVLEKRIAGHRGRPVRSISRSLVLVVIGHRCHGALSGPNTIVETLVYKYPANSFSRFVESQVPGPVRFAPAEDSDYRLDAHPEVLKTEYAKVRTKELPPEVQEKFWYIDDRLRRLGGVLPKYRGKRAKDLALYRRDRRVFARAKIRPNAILWRCSVPDTSNHVDSITMGVDSDLDKTFEILRDAYNAV
jgi:hypothetical protein